MHLEPIVAMIGHIKTLAEQLLPAVFTVRPGRICHVLTKPGILRLLLYPRGIDARRGGIKNFSDMLPRRFIADVQIAERGVVHDTGVVLAREDITGPPHVGSR